MANAKKDENGVSTLIALKQTDGATIVPIVADPTSHRLAISDGTGGTDYGPVNASHDENGVPTLMAVSSSDGITPVPVYCDLNGNLLTQST